MNDYTPVLGVRSPTEGAARVEELLVLLCWTAQWGQTPELESFLGGLQRLVQKCQASVAGEKKKNHTRKGESGLLEVSKDNGVHQIHITLVKTIREMY